MSSADSCGIYRRQVLPPPESSRTFLTTLSSFSGSSSFTMYHGGSGACASAWGVRADAATRVACMEWESGASSGVGVDRDTRPCVHIKKDQSVEPVSVGRCHVGLGWTWGIHAPSVYGDTIHSKSLSLFLLLLKKSSKVPSSDRKSVV